MRIQERAAQNNVSADIDSVVSYVVLSCIVLIRLTSPRPEEGPDPDPDPDLDPDPAAALSGSTTSPCSVTLAVLAGLAADVDAVSPPSRALFAAPAPAPAVPPPPPPPPPVVDEEG